MTRTALAVRCAPLGKIHHLLVDALPTGWAVTEFGPDGARAVAPDGRSSVIVTRADQDDVEWCHASVAGVDYLPAYADLVWLHQLVFGSGYAYQCFVPPSDHVNIHPYALHLWGRADGEPALPRFGTSGTI